MKEYHLLAYMLAYYAVTRQCEDKDDIVHEAMPDFLKKIPNSALYAVPFMFIAYIVTGFDSDTIEGVATIMAYIAGIRSMKAVLTSKCIQAESYLSPLVLSTILMLMYKDTGLRKNLFIMYTVYAAYSGALVAQSKTTSDAIIDDIALCHLVFYFTK